jgi:hypothetical protein
MGLLIVLTAVAQVFLHDTFKRKYLRMAFTIIKLISCRCKAVIDHLPMSLSTKILATKYHGHDPDPSQEVNMELFNKDSTRCFLPTCVLGSLYS